jgi:hypothetical protein
MGLGSTAILVTGAIGTFCLVAQRLHWPLRHRDFLLLGLLSFTTPILAIAHIPFTNLAAVGLLVSSFYGLNSCRHPSPLNCRSFPIQHPRYQRRFNRRDDRGTISGHDSRKIALPG